MRADKGLRFVRVSELCRPLKTRLEHNAEGELRGLKMAVAWQEKKMFWVATFYIRG